jgi:hypothetical protein
MRFDITIQGPAGNLSTFTKDYPSLFIAQTLTEADMELCNAVFSEAYDGREGRIVSITVSELDDTSVLNAEVVE